jgi:hypothetical protein
MNMKNTGSKSPRPPRPPRARKAHAEVLTPAIRIDATYLQGIALAVRQVIRETTLPALLDMCVSEAQRGQMELLFVPTSRQLDPLTMCEALEPELKRLGISSKILTQEVPHLGMTEEKTVLAVSWRNRV